MNFDIEQIHSDFCGGDDTEIKLLAVLVAVMAAVAVAVVAIVILEHYSENVVGDQHMAA